MNARSSARTSADFGRLFRLLVDNAQDIIFLYETTPEPGFVYVSPSVTRVSGYTPEEHYADPDINRKIVHPEDRMLLENVFKGDVPADKIALRWVRKDGSVLWTEQRLSPIQDEHGEVVAFEGIVRDVTDRMEVQTQIDLQIKALNAAASGILITDAIGTIVWANQAITTLTGHLPRELVGKHTRVLKSGKQDATFYRDLWTTISAGEVWRGELLNQRKDGTIYVDEMTITPVRGRDGSIQNYVAVKQDVTSRKVYEAGIIEAKEKAEEMSRLKTAFLNNMSHEIRTPLTGIVGIAEIVADHLKGDAHDFATMLYDSCWRLTRTLDSILTLAQLQSDVYDLSLEHVDVAETVTKAVRSFGVQAKQKKLSLNVVPASGEVAAVTDLTALDQVVTSVVSNAIKFTKHGGVTARVYAEGDQAVVVVEDTGIGMAEAFLPHAFDEFNQESRGLNRDFEGSGLGLSVAKRLVDLMRGSISIESEKGRGTSVVIRIPRVSTDLPASVPGAMRIVHGR